MKYLFNVSNAYTVEADTAEKARQLLVNNFESYRASWQEITLVEEVENKCLCTDEPPYKECSEHSGY
jgi:hypothetical protein